MFKQICAIGLILSTVGTGWTQSTELVSRRTATSKVYALEGSRRHSVISTKPIHYRSEATGQWQDIDNTISQTEDGFERMNANLKIRWFQDNGRIRLWGDDDRWVELDLQQTGYKTAESLRYDRGGVTLNTVPEQDNLLIHITGAEPVQIGTVLSPEVTMTLRGRSIEFRSKGRPFLAVKAADSATLSQTNDGGIVVTADDGKGLVIFSTIRGKKVHNAGISSRAKSSALALEEYDENAWDTSVLTDGGSYWNGFGDDIGHDSGVTGRGYLEFDVSSVPSVSSPTIDNAYMTTTVNGKGSASGYYVRDYTGSSRLVWHDSSEYSKLGSDTPIFHTASTNGSSFDDDGFSSSNMESAIKSHVSSSTWWFSVGIQNTDESTYAKSFDLYSSVLEFDWIEIDPPNILAATPTKSGVLVRWTQPADATQFIIEWKTPGAGTWSNSTTVGLVDSTVVSVASDVQLYNFRVKAKYGSVTSQPSTEARTNLRRANHPSDCRTDYDRLGDIDFPDFLLFAARVDDTPDSTGFEYRYDLNGDGLVDDDPDLAIFTSDYSIGACAYVPKLAIMANSFIGQNQGAEPSVVVTESGDLVDVSVRASSLVNLTGFEAVMKYDRVSLELVSAVPRGQMDAAIRQGQGLQIVKDNDEDARLAVALKNGSLSGQSQELAIFTFRRIGTTEPYIEFRELRLADGDRRVDRHFVNKDLGLNGGVWTAGLEQNWPNPFNPTTSIGFSIEERSEVSLVIYNVLGQEVRHLIFGEQIDPGKYRVTWDGKNDTGTPVSSGVYIYQLTAGTIRDARRMLFLK